MDAKEVANALASNAQSVCAYLLSAGKVSGRYWKVGDIYNNPGDSLTIILSGDKAGGWKDFAGAPEDKGDLLNLWSRVRQVSISEALREAKAWLGVEQPKFTAPAKRKYRKVASPTSKPAKRGTAVADYLRTERGLTDDTIKLFKIRQSDLGSWVRSDGTKYEVKGPWILFPYLRPGPNGSTQLANVKWLHVKRKKDPKTGKIKKQTAQEKNARPCLFGWHTIAEDDEEVAITEGEIDCMTIRQWGIASLSMPAGAGGGDKLNWIDEDWDLLEQFKTIYLVLDMDDEGQAAVLETASRLGLHRVRLVQLPYKDPNECLIKGAMAWEPQEGIPGARESFEEAKYLEPSELRSAADFVSRVIERFHPTSKESRGLRMPWNGLRRFYMLFGEVTLVTGINSHGKTTWLGQFTCHQIDDGIPALVASMEQRAEHTLATTAQQLMRDPRPSEEALRAIHEWYRGRLWIYDVKGSADRFKLVEAMTYARRRYGVRLVVIDSLMKCGIGEDDYEKQGEFIQTLVDWADTFSAHVILVIHPKKPSDEKKPVGKLDMKGTGKITDLAHNTVSVFRNKRKEEKLAEIAADEKVGGEIKAQREVDHELKPDTIVIVDKQRTEGWEGRANLWFHAETKTYRNGRHAAPPEFLTVPYSAKPDEDQEEIPF